MSFTKTQLSALETALAQNVLVVRYQDREIRYRSTDEMLRLRQKMRQALGLNDKKAQRIYAQFNSGL